MIVPIAIILLFLAMYVMRTGRSRMCRWRPTDHGRRHICTACGAEMETPDGKMPELCLRDGQG